MASEVLVLRLQIIQIIIFILNSFRGCFMRTVFKSALFTFKILQEQHSFNSLFLLDKCKVKGILLADYQFGTVLLALVTSYASCTFIMFQELH